MTDKAAISSLTYLSQESQKAALVGMPIFIIPDELHLLFRKTTRKSVSRIHVVSLGIIADKEKGFREFLAMAKKSNSEIVSQKDGRTFIVNGNCDNIVKWWKDARRNGSAKIGATISAEKKKATTKEAVDKIRARWPLPSSEWSTSVLLAEAGVSLNTAKAHLGRRPIEQANYAAAQKRKERRNAKAN